MNRRDFLKLTSVGILSKLIPQYIHEPTNNFNSKEQPNVLMIVFDAWTAKNVSLYGYQRDTTPNINQLAKKAIVYHNHYSGGPFTAPGTGSLLTGLYPWRHRVINCSGTIIPNKVSKNIFSELKDDYFQVTYTHNPCANTLLYHLKSEISNYIPREEFFLDKDIIFDKLFINDFDAANITRQLSLFEHIQNIQPSLFFKWIYSTIMEKKHKQYKTLYPRGLPHMGKTAQRFLLEDSVDWLINNIKSWKNPFFGYFHFLPPHDPYNPRKEFVDIFKDDGYEPFEKPIHMYSSGITKEARNHDQRLYDEFIRHIDSEFLRIYNSLESQGILENTWLILTSDHGESFERGEFHHTTNLLFEPVIKVPLLIFPPNQKQRTDIYTATNGVDLLPTILKLAKKEVPNWVEGTCLPFEPTQKNNSPIFSMNLKQNPHTAPISIGTIIMIHEEYKIMKLIGYPELQNDSQYIEAYHLEQDPEELNNLATGKNSIVDELSAMLDDRIREENQAFQ